MKSVIALMLLLFQMHLVSYCVEPDTVFVLSSNDKGWDVDDLGNLYVYDNYELRRYNRDKELTATFSSREFGPIGSLDVADPLRPALFYPMFSKIIELDQSLSISATWSPEIGARVSSLIGSRSAGQGYWIYDDLDRRPVKFDQYGRPLLQGTSLSSIESGNVLISEILCKGQWMVLNDKSFGFFVYDQFGTFSLGAVSLGGAQRFAAAARAGFACARAGAADQRVAGIAAPRTAQLGGQGFVAAPRDWPAGVLQG